METKPYSNYWFVQLFKLKRALHYSFNFDFLKSTSCKSCVYHPFTEHFRETAAGSGGVSMLSKWVSDICQNNRPK